MLHKSTVARHTYSFPARAFWRTSRFIEVKVLSRGRVVDRFSVSSQETLRETVRWTCRYLSEHEVMQFAGVEDERLPLGIKRVRREVALSSLEDALAFLNQDAA